MSVIVLVACGDKSEKVDEYGLTDEERQQGMEELKSKTYESDVKQEDIKIVKGKGTLDKPAGAGEFINIKGHLKTERHLSSVGEFSVGIKRVLVGDAAKNRVHDSYREDVEEGKQWIMVEIEVYNWGVDGKDNLTFLPEDFSIYAKDGEEIGIYDVELGNDPKRVAVYEGKPEVVVLVTQIEEGQDILVGVSKEITKEEKEDIEDGGNNKEEKDQKDLTKYLTVEGVYTLEEFNIRDDTDNRDLEELNKQEIEVDEDKEGNENKDEDEGNDEGEIDKDSETKEDDGKEENKNKEE